MPSRARFSTAALVMISAGVALSFACGGGGGGDDPAGADGGAAGSDGSIVGSDGASGSDGATTPSDAGADANTADAADAADAYVEPVDAGPPAVRFIGRFDTRDPAGPTCSWPGCKIIANFSGTQVSVRLNELRETWFELEAGPSEWDVTIDGVLKPKLVLTPLANDYVLAAGLPAGPHRVELYKRSETQNGYTQFLGYDFGAAGTLLPPPVPATRRIEIVGDSAPSAFGIEGEGLGPDCPGLDQGAKYQNFHKSFGQLLGDSVSAEVHGTVYSGKGLVKNIYRPDTATMGFLYPLVNPVKYGAGSAFDFTTWVPDAIVMMLGGNDFAIGQGPGDPSPATLADFTQATRTIVATFRSRNAQAHVFLVLSPSVGDNPNNGRTNVQTAFDTVAAERVAAGDTKVYSIAPPVAQAAELTGCNGHGNPAYHARVAQQIGVVLKQKTGW